MAENVLEFTDENFEQEVLKSSQPVLVDFWAPWCVPCRMLTPTIEELAGEYEGTAKIGKLNVDDNQNMPSTYGVSAIPKVLLFKEGQVVEQFGLAKKAELKEALDRLLA